MITLTVASPAAEREHAGALAIYFGTQNGWTPEEWISAFNATRQDGDGNTWHVMSMQVSESFVINNIGALSQLPDLVIWLDDPDAEPVQFPTAASHPDKIIAVIGPSGIDALAAIGLFAQVE